MLSLALSSRSRQAAFTLRPQVQLALGLTLKPAYAALSTEASDTTSGAPTAAAASVPLSLATYQVWGANTDVGKTLISAGLMWRATAAGKVPASNFYIHSCCSRRLEQVTYMMHSLCRHCF